MIETEHGYLSEVQYFTEIGKKMNWAMDGREEGGREVLFSSDCSEMRKTFSATPGGGLRTVPAVRDS